MRQYLMGLALMPVLFFAACKCDDKQCPAFNNEHALYSPQEGISTITYINGSGTEVTFNEVKKTATEAYVSKSKGSAPTCTVEPCNVKAAFSGTSMQSRNGKNLLNMDIATTLYQSTVVEYRAHMDYNILDFKGHLEYNPELTLNSSNHLQDSLIQSLQFDNRTFTNVLRQQADTLDSLHQNQQIWRVYLTAEDGIIGFEDRQTHSMFYLK